MTKIRHKNLCTMEIVNYSDVLQESTEVLEQCFKKYKISEIFLSFNGGKDCTVLLDLTLKVLRKRLNNCDELKQLRFVYIQPEHPFPELEQFIHQMKDQYNLNLIIIPGNIKIVLEKILKDDNCIKACLMGTRKTDPYSENLDFFQSTDVGWPQVIRVSPLLNWSYHHIWSYLIDNKVPYCDLYDRGYTSIGNINNTIPNPSLKIKGSSKDEDTYEPAYMLSDGVLERKGRGVTITNGS